MRAMLFIQGQLVTSKQAKTLRRAYLSHDLLQHMKQCKNWKSESTAEKYAGQHTNARSNA
jgi:hypothetical protein